MRRPQHGPATRPTTRARVGLVHGNRHLGALTVPVLHSPWHGGCPGPSDHTSPQHRALSCAAWPAPQSPTSSTVGAMPRCNVPGPYSPLPAALPEGTVRAGPVVRARHREPASPGVRQRPHGVTDPARGSPTHTAFVRGRPANRALDTALGTQPAQQHLIPLSQKPVCSLTS